MPTKTEQGDLALLDDPVAQALLRAPLPTRLAYVWHDGTPRVVPIGFHWDGQDLVIGTPPGAPGAPGAPKVAALRRNPKAAITIDTDAFPCKVLLIRGTATLETETEPIPEWVAAGKRMMGEELGTQVSQQFGALVPRMGGMVRIRVPPEWVDILFVLRHGLRRRDLPRELGYGSGVTCWRRLRAWQALGVWEAEHRTLLNWLGLLDAIAWERASLDSASVRAKRGGEATGPNPIDRGEAGTKYHLLVDDRGVPLAARVSAANVHDSKFLEPVVDAVPPIWRPIGEPGRPRRRPAKLHADKGYDYPVLRRALRRRGIMARIARRGVESSERLSRYRWKVERTIAWVLSFRRLTVRYERHAASVLAFLRRAEGG